MIRSGSLGVPFRTGFGAFGKSMTANETMDKIHTARVPEPTGTSWSSASILNCKTKASVRPSFARAWRSPDRESHPCYLETSERRDLAFYERLGFVVLEEATLGKGGSKAWAMRREPVKR